MAIHPVVAEIGQSGQKWWTNRCYSRVAKRTDSGSFLYARISAEVVCEEPADILADFATLLSAHIYICTVLV